STSTSISDPQRAGYAIGAHAHHNGRGGGTTRAEAFVLMTNDPFFTICAARLAAGTGAGQRIASGAGGSQINDQLTTMLTQISSSIKDLAASKNNQQDPMTAMLPMLMMMKQRQA